MAISFANDGRFIEDDGIFGLERGRVDIGLAHEFECAGAENRNVKPVVLARFDGFDEDLFVGLKLAGAPEHGVGPVESFDDEDCSFSDDDSLADVEAGNFFGDANAVFEIFGRDRFSRARHHADVRQVVVEEGAGVEQADADRVDFLRDGAKDGFRVLLFQFGQDRESAEIGVESIEQSAGRDLSGHDRVLGAEPGEIFEQFADLADFNDRTFIRRERIDQFGRGFALESDQADWQIVLANRRRDEHGVPSPSGEKRDLSARLKIGWQKAAKHRMRREEASWLFYRIARFDESSEAGLILDFGLGSLD